MSVPQSQIGEGKQSQLLRYIIKQLDRLQKITATGGGGGGGSATAANQVIGNNSLSSIDNKLPALGPATAANSLSITVATDEPPIPVAITGSASTGQATQTATVNNILTDPSGAAPIDVSNFQSATVQVVSTGTGGTYIFEGSNDGTNFQTIPVYNQIILTGTPITAAITATSSQLIYTFPINFRYLRLRIATTITGGSIRAFAIFKQTAWTPGIFQIGQATAANLNVTAAGQTAHSSASTGSPVRVGGRVTETTPATQDQTLVAGDAANIMVTTGGQLIQKPYATAEIDWHYAAPTGGLVSTTTAVTIKAASGTAGIRNYITSIDISADGAGTATELAIRDGAAGTVLWRIRIPAAGIATPMTFRFTTPLRGSSNTLLEVVTLTSSATVVYFNAHGYTSF